MDIYKFVVKRSPTFKVFNVLSLLPPVLSFMFNHFSPVQFTSYVSNNSQLDIFVLCVFYVRLSYHLLLFHFRIKFVYEVPLRHACYVFPKLIFLHVVTISIPRQGAEL